MRKTALHFGHWVSIFRELRGGGWCIQERSYDP
jgi:hypothetical protein